jgi:hypothetical protein
MSLCSCWAYTSPSRVRRYASPLLGNVRMKEMKGHDEDTMVDDDMGCNWNAGDADYGAKPGDHIVSGQRERGVDERCEQ